MIKLPFKNSAISLFIVLFIYVSAISLMPWFPVRNDMMDAIIQYTGMWQDYAVFAPNPRDVNLELEASIIYPDGSMKIWHYPRMEKLGLFERAQKERFRKFGYDHLNLDSERILWTDFARFIARLHDSVERHPTLIKLTRRWALIPPPEAGLTRSLPAHTNNHTFITYPVAPFDLLKL